MKLKIIRHVKALPADFIIIDLGAGAHFNTLDFFGMSDVGIVVTAPEPGAVMNAYSFIKGALFRKLQNVFRRHPEIGPLIDSEIKKTGDDKKITLEWLKDQINTLAPDMLPLLQEIEREFRLALVVNRIPEGQKHVLVNNLISLCDDKLGVTVEHAGNLPDTPEISRYLLNIPNFLSLHEGRQYLDSVRKITDRLVQLNPLKVSDSKVKTDFSDEEIENIIHFMESLDDSIFSGTNRNTWKLRMYFKPVEVVNFLISRGISHEAFYKE
jgi:flagellar biosynthesis protein FlhG